ncbi:MAG: hypothetical protein IJW55_05845 [Clostridia bacterium]|nr:hypothetical protein [Clostridia bacterium]
MWQHIQFALFASSQIESAIFKLKVLRNSTKCGVFMTEIVRGDDLKYVLAYNDFHNLESIGINGKTEKPIQYTYKKGNR